MPRTGKQLSWKPGYSLTRKPAKKSISRQRPGTGAKPDGSRIFQFIREYPFTDESQSRPLLNDGDPNATDLTLGCASYLAVRTQLDGASGGSGARPPRSNNVASSQHEASSHIEVDGARPYANNETSTPAPSPVEDARGVLLPHGGGHAPQDSDEGRCKSREPSPANNTTRRASFVHENRKQNRQLHDKSVRASRQNPAEFPPRAPTAERAPDLGKILQIDCSRPPSAVLYNDLLHQYKPVMIRYNTEFCKIPLTTDLQVNPFRYRTCISPEPNYLVHAVMALAGQHVGSSFTQHHRHASLQILRETLGSGNLCQTNHMLDAIILLFSLDETQSAYGNWSTHLVGAYALLEASGGIDQWKTSCRTIVQVAMLTWWDAILSLVAREDCVFPVAYFETILEFQDEDKWDYFGLCGCPLPMVKIVMQLAHLSAVKKKSLSIQYVTFDNGIVSDIEQSLESWQYVSPPKADEDEECMQQDRDRMHCSEAWRNGLILYIYRVFYWKPGEQAPMRFLSRARVITDHIFASRDDNMIARQALLPLFFAGCELKDQSTRRKITRYCTDWDYKTRYHMFYTTVPLLQQVWAEQEGRGFENTWWGQVVDKQHTTKSQHQLRNRLCFG